MYQKSESVNTKHAYLYMITYIPEHGWLDNVRYCYRTSPRLLFRGYPFFWAIAIYDALTPWEGQPSSSYSCTKQACDGQWAASAGISEAILRRENHEFIPLVDHNRWIPSFPNKSKTMTTWQKLHLDLRSLPVNFQAVPSAAAQSVAACKTRRTGGSTQHFTIEEQLQTGGWFKKWKHNEPRKFDCWTGKFALWIPHDWHVAPFFPNIPKRERE